MDIHFLKTWRNIRKGEHQKLRQYISLMKKTSNLCDYQSCGINSVYWCQCDGSYARSSCYPDLWILLPIQKRYESWDTLIGVGDAVLYFLHIKVDDTWAFLSECAICCPIPGRRLAGGGVGYHPKHCCEKRNVFSHVEPAWLKLLEPND